MQAKGKEMIKFNIINCFVFVNPAVVAWLFFCAGGGMNDFATVQGKNKSEVTRLQSTNFWYNYLFLKHIFCNLFCSLRVTSGLYQGYKPVFGGYSNKEAC